MANSRIVESLGGHFGDFVDAQIRSGRYADETDVLRAGLRLLEDREGRLEAARVLVDAADQDVAEGRLRVYENGDDLLAAVLQRSEQ